jgi:cell volume regulation protein A
VDATEVIFTIGTMLAAGLIAQPIAGLLHVPHMLVLLVAGAVLGPSVADLIDVPLDSTGIEIVLTLGVSFILFHGGLQLSARVLRQVAVGLGMLVIPGVIITSVVVGVVAYAVFDIPFSMGLLIGAALAPTDPAILIPLFERIRIRPKVSQTVIAESALNDPTGAVLTLTFLGVVMSGESSATEPVVDFVKELGISTALGIGFGVLLALVVSSRRAGLWGESAGIAVLAIVSLGFFSVDSAGGSGYLGAFIAGLIVGNMDVLKLGMHSRHELDMRALVANVSDVMVIFVFVTLGANLPFDTIADEWAPGLGVIAALLLVARPLAVLASLLPDRRGRWTHPEILFLCWTRETGVVPAALAGIIVAEGVEDADLVVVTVALAIIVTLTLQASSKGWLARRLGLVETVFTERIPVTDGPEVLQPPSGRNR